MAKLRKGLALLLALVMCLSMMNLTAFAYDEPWEYIGNGGYVTIY